MRARYKPLFVASVDIIKATVFHRAILQTLRTRSCPQPMLEYVKSVYSDAFTTIVSDRWQSHIIHSKDGARQGDPMFPYIFNMIVDRLLKLFPAKIDVKIGTANFVDDLILTTSKKSGLQELLDSTEFPPCGMSVNVGKFFTISIGTVPRQKKTTVDEGTFHLSRQKLR